MCGQLTAPVTSAAAWSAVMGDTFVPFDDREAEVLYAGIAAGSGISWLLLQVTVTHYS